MKITMTVAFDPLAISAPEVQKALVAAGISAQDIKVGTTRERPAKPKAAK